MKKLILVRHAKSDWDYSFLKDIDRPLSERGYRSAYLMSKLAKENKMIPDAIYTSPATRAISTAFIFQRELDVSINHFHVRPKVYEASVSSLLNVIEELNGTYHRIMLFGHNPGFTHLYNHFTDLSIENIPTCGVVELKFKAQSWNGISKLKAEVDFYDFPKNHIAE